MIELLGDANDFFKNVEAVTINYTWFWYCKLWV